MQLGVGREAELVKFKSTFGDRETRCFEMIDSVYRAASFYPTKDIQI